ncbi:MAG: flagellar assembly protein FliX [Alphaproteobacteria bacterium]|nr:flagellar assembly protein FliX [Alphaproteobacteria bacterium]
MMRINEPGQTQAVSSKNKTKGKNTSGLSFSLDTSVPESATFGFSSVSSLRDIDAILTEQEIKNSPDDKGRGRAVNRGSGLLDTLELLRIDLLTGAIPKERLEQLVSQLSQHRSPLSEPDLQSLLDDIELRAYVELAKFRGQEASAQG